MTRDQHQLNDHRAWSLPPGPAPGRASSRATCSGRACGETREHLLLLLLPRPTHRHLALDQLPWVGQRGAAACAPAKRRPGLPSMLVPATHYQRSTIPSPPGPIWQRRPRRPPAAATCRTRFANRGRSRHTDVRDPAWRGQRGCSGRGHRTPGCPDTWITPVVWTPVARTPDAWTPVARTPDVRPTGWTDVGPHGGQRTRTARRTAWPASGHPGRPRRRRRRLGDPNLTRVAASAALAAHDGSACRHLPPR
jgi:hypothetical protein